MNMEQGEICKWEDVCIRSASNGVWYVLQKKRHEDGRLEFCNRLVDKLPSFTSILGRELFHGRQTLPESF